jgi:NAD(P)-dependent dehydrogenase (short-subunit alcohol dehydrogenase family)
MVYLCVAENKRSLDMPKLDKQAALITGGNSGLGLATAKLFAAEGAQVIITGRRKAAVDEAVAAIGHNAVGLQSDASDLQDIDRLFAEIERRFGRLDVIFANAGSLTLAPFDQVSPAQFDFEFATNVRGVFFTVQKALPLLRDGGSIILNASVAHYTGNAGYSVYGAAKAAVRSFARNWSVDLKDRKIRVNCISPGPHETPIIEKMGVTPDVMAKVLIPHILAQVPLGRMGQPEELATAALFLASSDSSFVTGIDLCVDGGMGQV